MRSCLFFLPFFLVACGDGIESSSVRRLDVDHFRAPCPTESTELCLIVRAEGINDFGYWSRPIDGFTHQWGHGYVIDVEEIVLDSGPNGSQGRVEYELVKIVSDTPVEEGTTFDVTIYGSLDGEAEAPSLTFDGNGGGSVAGAMPFVCYNDSVCASAAQARDAGQTADFTFRYGEAMTLPLVLFNVTPR
jgi:hypothetical protein